MRWPAESVFYHIYPLGFCNAPLKNDRISPPVNRLKKIEQIIPELQDLGITALYLGPVHESGSHGYDSINLMKVDPRLGDEDDLKNLVEELHSAGIKVVLDAVFNHTGRDFPLFQDVLNRRNESDGQYWFEDMDFTGNNSYNDSLSYADWSGCQDLVKLNYSHPPVRQHILDTVKYWMDEWHIDGLRLDAADCLPSGFLEELRAFCTVQKDDFWLMGEVVFDDYRRLAAPERLHGVTNYELYKSLYSSFNDKNLFELEYALTRQSGKNGIYRNMDLYTFTENHDVNRVASQLEDPKHIYLLYLLHFTLPGIPSLYYGGEWGVQGMRMVNSDTALRPAWNEMDKQNPQGMELREMIRFFISIRNRFPALQQGDYETVLIQSELFCFRRKTRNQNILILINMSEKTHSVKLPSGTFALEKTLTDELDRNRRQLKSDNDGSLVLYAWPLWATLISY